MNTANSAALVLVLSLLAFPFLSFLISSGISKKLAWVTPIVATLLVLAATIATAVLAFKNGALPPQHFSLNWFQLGEHIIHFSISIQPVTLILLVVVAVVSFLVHLFSIGYMVHDTGVQRYFAFLGLFTFSMLALVLSDNLLQLFVCWELVGLCSYFLIGHWRERPAAAQAATKAFLMNRLGDAGLLIGLALLWAKTNTLDITTLSSYAWKDDSWQTWVGLCLFLGAVGKSAQFPLLTWLPDAMEGPTPVSALIHAATMVAAGVYLLVRLHFIFTPDISWIIALVGATTALYGAWHALHQFDMKKVLAYSTLSQLGLMVMAIGAGAWAGGFFHLFTHAFFKAGLFLCAGAIIHSLQHAGLTDRDAQDIRLMGGLRRYLPNAFIAFLLAAAGLAGIPFFSGFVSKEAMLTALVHNTTHNPTSWIWVIIYFVISFLTVLYTFRLVRHVFFGEFKSAGRTGELASTPMIMVLPMALLAMASLWLMASINPFGSQTWLTESISTTQPGSQWIAFVSIAWVVVALAVAYRLYAKDLAARESNPSLLDVVYQRALISPTLHMAGLVSKADVYGIDRLLHRFAYTQVATAFLVGWFDRYIVDGLVTFLGTLLKSTGRLVRLSAKGSIQGYVLWSALAFVIFLFWLLK